MSNTFEEKKSLVKIDKKGEREWHVSSIYNTDEIKVVWYTCTRKRYFVLFHLQ